MTESLQPSHRSDALPLLAVGFALSLAVGVAVGLWWLGLPWLRLAESWAMRIFWFCLLLTLGTLATGAAVSRRIPGGVFWIGCFLVTLAIGSEVAFGFQGSLRMGEGEPQPPFQEVLAGPWARGGVPALEYQGISPDNGRFLVVADSRDLEVEQGQEKSLGRGYGARVTEVGAAPYFAVSDVEGNVLHEGLVKLAEEVGRDEFIYVGLLPHRFYFSRLEGEVEGEVTETPEELHLHVQRGKIKAFDQELRIDELVTIEGFDFRFEEGSSWIGLEIRRRPRWIFLGASFGVLAAGLALLLVESRRR